MPPWPPHFAPACKAPPLPGRRPLGSLPSSGRPAPGPGRPLAPPPQPKYQPLNENGRARESPSPGEPGATGRDGAGTGRASSAGSPPNNAPCAAPIRPCPQPKCQPPRPQLAAPGRPPPPAPGSRAPRAATGRARAGHQQQAAPQQCPHGHPTLVIPLQQWVVGEQAARNFGQFAGLCGLATRHCFSCTGIPLITFTYRDAWLITKRIQGHLAEKNTPSPTRRRATSDGLWGCSGSRLGSYLGI